jgi:myo-inositol-1(or 4)-monophosphatase
VTSLETFLALAVRAAHAAGEIQLRNLGTDLGIDEKTSDSDLVTRTDKECEATIRQLILAAHPDHAILGEEGGQQGSSRFEWIVDPLDGTVNYAHGFPFFCVSIGLEIDGVPSLGVVFDPNRNETFTTTRGGGAFLNGKRIAVSAQAKLTGRAMLATGFPYDTATALVAVEVFKRFLAKGLPIRRPGAAALDLCYVACGRIDAFWEYKLNAWDCAAGNLMILEAGGQVTNFTGEPYVYASKKLVASNGLLHQEMLETIDLA